MASLYKRRRSPYWWIKFRDPSGLIRQESTGLRHDDPAHTRRARQRLAERNLEEITKPGSPRDSLWRHWVEPFLRGAYAHSPKTLTRYLNAWHNLSAYLDHKKIPAPAQLTYKTCYDYLAWRLRPPPGLGVRQASHNTVVVELKTLHLICDHAVRLGYLTANPAARLRIGRQPAREKPEIPDSDLLHIWEALAVEPEWMRASFLIALHTGCRLSETRIHADQIHLSDRAITFLSPKGGRTKTFTVPIRDELLPLLSRVVQTGGYTLEFPPSPAKSWWLFFRRIGRPGYSFHCLRVTFISRAARAGVPEREIMRLANHASPTINRIYQRYRVEDLRSALGRVSIPDLGKNPDAP